ncbi:hypothetical protein U1Q18_027202 [Sarracenia purpurea var. burkii]
MPLSCYYDYVDHIHRMADGVLGVDDDDDDQAFLFVDRLQRFRLSSSSSSAQHRHRRHRLSSLDQIPAKDDGDKQEKREEDNAECEKCLDDDGDEERGEEDIEPDGTSNGKNEVELNFTLSFGSSGDCTTEQNVSLSPLDDLFFKGRLVPIEPSPFVFNETKGQVQRRRSINRNRKSFKSKTNRIISHRASFLR